MKNIIRYLIVVFSLLSFQWAQAQSCETTEIKLSQMQFLGEPYTKVFQEALGKSITCKMVPVTKPATSLKGVKACKERGVVVNPGNPQYVGAGYGNLLDNDLGYYFCVNSSGELKKNLCNYMKRKLTATLDVWWDNKSSNDGDCMCRRKGDTSAGAYVSCTVENVQALEADKSTGCEIKDATKEKETNVCVCLHDSRIEPKKDGDCPTAPPKQVTETVDDKDFDECFADIQAAKEACSEKGKSAIDKCSKEAPDVNKNIKEAQRVLSIGLDALIAKNANTGALDACAKMSAGGTGVIEALSLLQKTCRAELANCKKGCEDIKAYSQEDTNKMLNACKAKFEEKYKNVTPTKTWTTEHDNRFAVLADQYKKGADNAEKFCKGDAQVADGQLDQFLNELALSVQKADICKCQLSAGSLNSGAIKKDRCEDIVTPLTCMQNMNQPGCSYSSVGCAPGSTDPRCRVGPVAINPNGSGLAAPPSGFAGPGFASTGGGANSGKVQIGGDDLSGLFDETRPTGSGTATADGGSPFGVAGGGGAPGVGVNMGGGDGSGNGANGEGGEKDRLSGFFQNAKGAISSIFGGGGNNDKGAAPKGPNSKAYKNDVNGFRPKPPALRGMANTGEFGGKNRDIWKTMNQRYNDQYHTFITVENPSK